MANTCIKIAREKSREKYIMPVLFLLNLQYYAEISGIFDKIYFLTGKIQKI